MEKIEVTKGTNMIPLVFNITDFQIPKTASATAYITGASGKTKKKLCDVAGNKITLEPTSDLFSVGNNDIQIRIVNDTKTLVTFNTNCYCENSVEFGDAAEEKEQTLIEQLLASQGKIQTGLNNEIEERTKLLNEQNEKINKINTDKIDKTGNAGSTTVEFEESGIRENVETGETMAIIIGKIAKWFKDLKSGAFAEVANDLVTTVEGKVLDARQGKVLEEKITDLNSKMLTEEFTKTANGYTYNVEKYTFGNQKRAIVHGTWTGEINGLTFAGFYQGTIQNLLPIHTILGLSIKRVVEYNFRCSSGGGSLMILGTATITKRGDSVGANVQFAKSQAKNTCTLEWDMEVELQ